MRKVISIVLVLFFMSCSDVGIEFSDGAINNGGGNGNENGGGNTTEIYFTYKVYETTIFRDNWIILHDENGEILDFTRYENGDELIFEKDRSLLTDNISVTLFTQSNVGINQYFEIATTLNIPIGTVWDDEPTVPVYSNPIGNFDLTLSNFPQIIGLYISNENSLVSSGNFTGTEIGTSGIYNYTTTPMELFPENEYFITFIEDNQDFKYQYVEDVEDGDVINVDYTDFQYFDNYLDVTLPANSVYRFLINGFEDYQELNDENGYVVGNAHYTNDGYMNEFLERNPLRIGYLDRYDYYRTELDVYMYDDLYNYKYKNLGERPNSIIVPLKPVYNNLDSSIQNFDFTVDITYETYTSYWESDIGDYDVDYVNTRWKVTNEFDSNYFYAILPDALFLLYPDLDISELEAEEIDFNLNSEEKITL